MRPIALVAACAAGLVALTACAADPGTTPGDGGSLTTSGVTMTPSSTPEPGPSETYDDPPPEVSQPAMTFSPGSEVTVTGTIVVSEVETGCVLLEGYELMGGDPAVIQPGRRVRVTGRVASDMVSICQQGPILMVISAQPA